MRRWLWAKIFVGAFGLVLGGTEGTSAQPTSEGRPHKWLAVEKVSRISSLTVSS